MECMCVQNIEPLIEVLLMYVCVFFSKCLDRIRGCYA